MDRILSLLGIFAALCALPNGAMAQASAPLPGANLSAGDTLTLSLTDVQRLTLKQNPVFLAEQQEAEIARGELRQARVYNYNPELEFEAPGAGTAGSVGEYEVRFSQEIAWAGQRGLRVDAAEVGLNRVQFGVANAARSALAEVSTAYYAAFAAERRLDVADEVLALNERLLEATRIQLREGEISELEANLAEIEFGRARARVLTARREAESARLALKRRIGTSPEQPIQLVDDLPETPDPGALNADRLVALALERRPDLAARTAAVEQFQTLRRLAAREAIPNLSVSIFAERATEPRLLLDGGEPFLSESLQSEPRIGIGISLPVPLWDRNQGVRAQREAQADQAVLRRAASELAIRTEFTDAYRAYLTANEEARVYEEDVLQPAQQNQELLEIAYRAGKIDLASLILLRNQLLEAELGFWEAWLAQRRALIDLQAATSTLENEVFSIDNLEGSNDR